MAFMKYARATVVQPHVTREGWKQVRTASTSEVSLQENLIDRAGGIFKSPFDPKKFLLTHATIVCSVDSYTPEGMKTGSILDNGFRVNRRYPDFRITPETDKYINNNLDAWVRGVLLKSFLTFIGAHNFVEHVQVEDLSKGRIIDAVARDIGESIYIDILIATDRKHTDLVKSIESGKTSTLSMGCFLPGTQVTMADGRRIAIEDVQPGDMVLTHKGRAREVLNKQIRGGQWGIRKIRAVGVPNIIEATDNHPFFVFRQPDTCACGCGDALPEYKGGRKNATRGLNRRFLRGHDKRILNPNNTYSMQEYQERKARLDAIQAGDGQWVRADQLRVDDFVCFPRVLEEGSGTTDGRARLLGYFLAEGSFQKYKGERSAVEFSFSMDEKDTFVAEVVQLLRQEFPGKESTVNPHPNRNVCSVRLGNRQAALWFYTHGGEYGNGKMLSPDAMGWTIENHKHLIGAWLNGDGGCGRQYSNQSTAGTTTSYSLACQMHLLMSRCGWFARLECKVGARQVELQEVINGGFVRDEVSGRLPSFNLVIGKVLAQTLAPYTVKVAPDPGFQTQGPRVRDDMVIFPITSIEKATYDGWVHNMEVAEDNSYVVSGICSHNCTVDGTICTKCGHWAADETEMCFPPGTRVLLADGRYAPIEEIVEGDLVTTHTGATQPVRHTMGRPHEGHITVLKVDGVPQPIRSTTGHRFWVMRPETKCQCGCGEDLHQTVEHERGSVKAFQRRFLPGHNSRVQDIRQDRGTKLEFVPVKEIRSGDYLTFPIPQAVANTSDATENRARLIGYFLAEGSFIKRDGQRVGISFDFGAHEYETLAAEVETLLNAEWGRPERRTVDVGWQAKVAAGGIRPIRRRSTSRPVPVDLVCPACSAPSEYAFNARFAPGRDDCYKCKVCGRQWIEGADREVQARRTLTGESACTVRLMLADATEWFYRYCGEYAHAKVLHKDVMIWAPEIQKHVLFGWLGGDGTQSQMGITGDTASFDLVSQMHVLAARCGWYSRKQVLFDGRAAVLDEVVNGSGTVTVRDSRGWLPSFSLTLPEPTGFGGEVRFDNPDHARVTMSSVTEGYKRVGNWLIYRVREAWNECYSGMVHNIEVAGDQSYVVEGVAVHNCPHVKYQKGNTFYDEQGRHHRVAELCGHPSLGPHGGVHFVEASWVGTPAFTGAVMRNILAPQQRGSEIAKRAEEILNTPPPQWSADAYLKAASSARANLEGYLAGWGDEGGGDEGGGEAAPAEPAAPKPEENPLDQAEKELEAFLVKRVTEKVRTRLEGPKEAPPGPETPTTTNETIVKEATLRVYQASLHTLMRVASSDVEFLDGVAAMNKAAGIDLPVQLYRVAVSASEVMTGHRNDMVRFAGACRDALGRKPTPAEACTLVRLGKLLTRRSQVRQASTKSPGSRQQGDVR